MCVIILTHIIQAFISLKGTFTNDVTSMMMEGVLEKVTQGRKMTAEEGVRCSVKNAVIFYIREI